MSEASDGNITTILPLPELYSIRGKYFSAEGKSRSALMDCMKALELGSTSEFMFWGYAYELDQFGRNEMARVFFNRANQSETASDSKYLEKPVSLKTKAFISRRIQSASKYIAIPEELASTAILYSRAYLFEMGEKNLIAGIQNLLTLMGYKPGQIDGKVGANTQSAIREFQKDNGIPADGDPTEELYNRLKITLAGIAGPDLQKGAKRPLRRAELSVPEVVQQVMPAVVAVISYNGKDEPAQMGSGFYVDGDYIVTNCHVIEGANKIKVKTYDGVFRTAKLNYADQSRDLALITIGGQYFSKRKLPVSKNLPEIGSTIIAIGNPMGLEQTVSDGIVSAVRKIDKDLNLIQITAPISPGSSGGPVLNLKGEVIGVSTLYLAKGQSLNFAVSAKHIDEMIQKHKVP